MTIFIGLINGMISAQRQSSLSALGGALTYYAGIFNIAMEGMMLSGAFFAVLGSYYFGNWLIGMLFGILGALLIAGIFILFSVVLKVDEFVTGVGLNMFSVGLTTISAFVRFLK
jgi:simple sugar transport system permease protein